MATRPALHGWIPRCCHKPHQRAVRSLFFFNDPPPTEIYTLSLHDALPIFARHPLRGAGATAALPRIPVRQPESAARSEEHTSELQSHHDLVCRLLLEKKKN